MKKIISVLLIGLFFGSCQNNKLSRIEKTNGYTLLFDGKSNTGWRGAYQNQFPSHGWVIKNQQLLGQLSSGKESGDGGDIIYVKKIQKF
jgi:hypothetical protein